MLKPIPVLMFVAVVAIGASQLVSTDSSIASIAATEDQPSRSVASRSAPDAPMPPQNASTVKETEGLNFNQPVTSSATLSDFYADELDENSFASKSDDGEAQGQPLPAQISTEPAQQTVARQQPAPRRAAAPKPTGGIPSNGKPDQPLDLGSRPPPNLGF